MNRPEPRRHSNARILFVTMTGLLVIVSPLAVTKATGGTPLDACPEAEVPDPASAQIGPIRFGVTAAGLVFSTQPPVTPDDVAANIEASETLAGRNDFVLRLNRFYFSEGAEGIARFASLAKTYSKRGFDITLQLRYGGPRTTVAGTPMEFASWVRDVVAELGKNRHVIGIEVTNEANLATAPDNSDGAHPDVVEALVQGVIAAKAEALERRYHHVGVGFNWFHHTGADTEAQFWSSLKEKGGDEFARSLDWIGLNAYPGTYDAFVSVPGSEDQEVLKALSALRKCFLPTIGVGPEVPIRVTELGFPNGIGRTEQQMSDVMERMVRAVSAHAGSFNVTDLYWFNLRDTGGEDKVPNEWHYGLLRHDYTPKLGFESYRSLVQELSD